MVVRTVRLTEERRNDPNRVEGMLPRQKAFADRYLELGNAAQAYRDIYGPSSVLRNGDSAHASTMLRRPEIKFYVQRKREELKDHLFKLAVSARSEQVQLGATINALDRCFGKPTASVELSGKDGGPISMASMALIYEKALKASNDGGEGGDGGGK